MNFFKKLLVFSFATVSPLLSQTCDLPNFSSEGSPETPCYRRMHSNRYIPIYLGPEIYNVHRTREGGAVQDGLVYAIKGGYDRVRRWKLYFGFEGLYGKGTLQGKSASGNCLKSNFTDAHLEGRFGYTLRLKKSCRFLFTPFIGAGYAVEKNNFTEPAETPIHFRISYVYLSAGFLSDMKISKKLNIGLNFKIKYPYEAKCRVSNDPNGDDLTQVINDEIQYRTELPITYNAFGNSRFLLSVVPFMEYRSYGYHPNFPYDFLKTKLNIYGAQLKFIYLL